MNWKYLLTGVGLLITAYFIFRQLRKRGPASEKNNWDGPVPSLYIQGWGALIICAIVGIVLILKSLPARI